MVNERLSAETTIRNVRSEGHPQDPLMQVMSETEQFENKVFENQKSFKAFVENRIMQEDDLVYLKVLRRWNSYTPIVADNYHISKGGGYFLKLRGKGLVIDPGFNFIDNFKGSGHCFDEINAVMISHAHNDHTSDLESILTLLNDCNKRRKGLDDFVSEKTLRADLAKSRGVDIRNILEEEIEKAFLEKPFWRKTINFYITKSVDKKFAGMLNLYSKNDYAYHIIEKDDEKTLFDGLLKVKVIGAKHNDIISDQDSVGFVIDFDDTVFIYTGDTGWNDEIENQYKNIHKNFEGKHITLLAHIGGFKGYERKYLIPKERTEAFYKHHLGRLGLARLVSIVKPNICFISEFGEELKNHREELADIYNAIFSPSTFFLPADIGLEYHFHKNKVRVITELDLDTFEYRTGLVDPSDVKTCLLRKDYSLHYFSARAPFKGTDLIQVLMKQFEMISK